MIFTISKIVNLLNSNKIQKLSANQLVPLYIEVLLDLQIISETN